MVKWYDPHKGYGFIRDQDGREVFVHFSALGQQGATSGMQRALHPGQGVEYDLEETEKGQAAKDVRSMPG